MFWCHWMKSKGKNQTLQTSSAAQKYKEFPVYCHLSPERRQPVRSDPMRRIFQSLEGEKAYFWTPTIHEVMKSTILHISWIWIKTFLWRPSCEDCVIWCNSFTLCQNKSLDKQLITLFLSALFLQILLRILYYCGGHMSYLSNYKLLRTFGAQMSPNEFILCLQLQGLG